MLVKGFFANMSQPFSTFLYFGLVLLLLAADGNALCTISSSFVLGGKIVAVFNSSTECMFPEPFLRLSLPTVSSVDFIVIGGGGGPGTNAAGGGGAGGVVTQTVSISNGNTINFAVGSGGTLPLTQYESNGSPGQETKVTIDKISITASGGGYGGTRDFEQFGATGGPGASGGGGAGGGCNATSQTCGVPSTAGGSGTAQGKGGGAGFQASPDVGCLSVGGGGGGFSKAGSDATSGQGGKGGDGYQLPFGPFMSSFVAGGGGGGITCAPAKSGLDGLGRDSYGGGGFARDGLRVNYQNGEAGAVFMSFPYVCPAGTYKKVLSGTFSQSPCDPCDRGYFSSTTNSSSCQMCPGGTFNDQIGASMCSPCSAGSFSGPGETSCTPRSPGATRLANQIAPYVLPERSWDFSAINHALCVLLVIFRPLMALLLVQCVPLAAIVLRAQSRRVVVLSVLSSQIVVPAAVLLVLRRMFSLLGSVHAHTTPHQTADLLCLNALSVFFPSSPWVACASL